MMQNADAVAGGMAMEISGEAELLEVAGLHWSVPSEWERNTSPGPMRAAEFRASKPDEADGEVTIVWFYFPGGQGGGVVDNIARWSTMVTDESGRAAEPEIKQRTYNGIKATVVTLEGTYQDGPPGGVKVPRPGYILRGVIFEGPEGLIFLRSTGPREVMNAIFRQWERMIQGTRRNNM